MSRVIPNEETWIGFTETAPANLAAPTEAEIDGCLDLTGFCSTLNPSATGNVIPTPAFDSLFETSAIGTSQGSFTGDFYRDDVNDAAWGALPRKKQGFFIIGRFGLTRSTPAGKPKPGTGDDVEVWPVLVSARTAQPLANNTIQAFSITCAVNIEPEEDAIVGAAGGVPSVPLNLVGSPGATGVAVLDWDAPTNGAPITGYKVYRSTTLGGSYTEVTTNITKVGTTATLTSLTAGAGNFFKVLATNANGDGPQTAVGVQVTVAA